jgi:hypothetical protein
MRGDPSAAMENLFTGTGGAKHEDTSDWIVKAVREMLKDNANNAVRSRYHHKYPGTLLWAIKHAWLDKSPGRGWEPLKVYIHDAAVSFGKKEPNAKKDYLDIAKLRRICGGEQSAEPDMILCILFAFFENWIQREPGKYGPLCLDNKCANICDCGENDRKERIEKLQKILLSGQSEIRFHSEIRFIESPGIPIDNVYNFCSEEKIDILFPVDFERAMKWEINEFFSSFSHIEAFLTVGKGGKFIYVLKPFDQDKEPVAAAGESLYRAALERVRRRLLRNDLKDSDIDKRLSFLWCRDPTSTFPVNTSTIFNLDLTNIDREFNDNVIKLQDQYHKTVRKEQNPKRIISLHHDFLAFVKDKEIRYGIVAMPFEFEKESGKESGKYTLYEIPVSLVRDLGEGTKSSIDAVCRILDCGESSDNMKGSWQVIGLKEFLELPKNR